MINLLYNLSSDSKYSRVLLFLISVESKTKAFVRWQQTRKRSENDLPTPFGP